MSKLRQPGLLSSDIFSRACIVWSGGPAPAERLEEFMSQKRFQDEILKISEEYFEAVASDWCLFNGRHHTSPWLGYKTSRKLPKAPVIAAFLVFSGVDETMTQAFFFGRSSLSQLSKAKKILIAVIISSFLAFYNLLGPSSKPILNEKASHQLKGLSFYSRVWRKALTSPFKSTASYFNNHVEDEVKKQLLQSINLTSVHHIQSWPSPTLPLEINASLDDRLNDWASAPLPEPAEWVKFNLKTCSDHRVGKNANYDLLKRAHLFWSTITSDHIRDKRKELINYLKLVQRIGLLDQDYFGKGKGIVFTAGNVDTFARVLLTTRMLRENLNCHLPIEIFSFPDEKPDQDTKAQLTRLNAKFLTVNWAQKDLQRSKNFQIKASALVYCSFREPLYLDSDNLPAVLEPGVIESLWQSKGYQKLGALFWPDYWKTHADVPIWLLIGTQCRDEWEQEAGQILIDKSKHLDALLLAEYMLKDWRYWFQISDGDKDIFRYAMLALRKRWALPGRYLGAAGLSWNTLTGYCGHTMLQHDPIGRPLFVHMNLLKQIPSGVNRGETFKRTRTVNVQLIGNEKEIDYGVEADMLANADDQGQAIMDAPAPVRRRAALERGLRPFLHGGGNSAICVDIEWQNPGLKSMTKIPEKNNQDEKLKKADDDLRQNIIEWHDPTELVLWNNDNRLKSFEDYYYDMGGRTNAAGF
ncbi:hypothetical protein O181_040694 [Austropuccinia psidii MF-1]|uniref:Alpha-1,3-mannosyltransferase n=1 Tax=Austropuccinia psidii MF-1 TaxID=1389203 RepID=A0A9Q3HFS7_9BASI|nr:hypothetical protein [Austropuccinia psidii MF-1]